jgi:hypothetical protein
MVTTLLLLGCGLEDGTPVEQSAEEQYPAALTGCRQCLRTCVGRGRNTNRRRPGGRCTIVAETFGLVRGPGAY